MSVNFRLDGIAIIMFIVLQHYIMSEYFLVVRAPRAARTPASNFKKHVYLLQQYNVIVCSGERALRAARTPASDI